MAGSADKVDVHSLKVTCQNLPSHQLQISRIAFQRSILVRHPMLLAGSGRRDGQAVFKYAFVPNLLADKSRWGLGMRLIRQRTLLSFVCLQVATVPCLAHTPVNPASARIVKVLNLIEYNYVEMPDMMRLTKLGIAEIGRRSRTDDEAWSKCVAANGELGISRKQRETGVLAAWSCAGLDQGSADDAGAKSDAIIEAIVASLDMQSRWFSAEKFKTLQSEQALGAVGISVRKDDEKLFVVRTGAKTPSRESGIEDGDAILAIDGVSTANLSLVRAVEQMRGGVGSPIALTVKRGVAPARVLSLQRRKIDPVESAIETYRRGDATIARLMSSYNGGSVYLEKLLMEQLPSTKVIILDLRGNDGGLFDEVLAVSDLFLDKATIVTSHGRPPYNMETWMSKKGQVAPGIPLIVLTDKNTVSGGEIIASALQDNKRAIVVGQKSFGAYVTDQKGYLGGSVQTLLAVDRNHALKLTTSYEYRPNGQRLADAPIVPDCASDLEKDDLVDFAMQVLANQGACPDKAGSVSERDSSARTESSLPR